ncbi:MAG: hypothetical protein ACK2UM_19205 [Anaerolineales bacterium]
MDKSLIEPMIDNLLNRYLSHVPGLQDIGTNAPSFISGGSKWHD